MLQLDLIMCAVSALVYTTLAGHSHVMLLDGCSTLFLLYFLLLHAKAGNHTYAYTINH